MITPRPYQQYTIDQFNNWLDTSSDDLATIILPTGTGKTKTAIWCAKGRPNLKTLWVAHREELIQQAYDDFVEMIPERDTQIEMAAQRAGADADTIVGSIQTLHRNRKNIKDFNPDLVVVDEWHHHDEKNKMYAGLRERYPNARFLGLTATPYRFVGNDLPLGRELIRMDIGQAVDMQYLVPPTPEALKSKTSLAGIHTRGGDFAIDELSKAVNVSDRNQLIARRIIKAVKEEKRQGILFAVDVAHAKAMYELLKNEVRAAEVYGETDKEERRGIMRRMRAGEIDVFVNNLICTEGFDVPHISFVVIARPTKSLGLYTQMFGRGLRLSDNKDNCLVIDVHDKVKTTQSRITFSDAANAGDIDGSNRRIGGIMKEEIAKTIVNFPVIKAIGKDQRWTVDNEKWFAPAWVLAENQWVISWIKRDELIPTDQFRYVPFKYPPKQSQFNKAPIQVRHQEHGDGVAIGIETVDKVIVDFPLPHGRKFVPFWSLLKQEIAYEKRTLPAPIRRVIYVCMQNERRGRIISLKQNSSGFEVESDNVGDFTTLNEIIKVMAEKDDMMQIARADAKWRTRPISDKQKGLLQSYMSWGKIDDDLELDGMTGGDASAVIDQINWRDAINKLFGTSDIAKLIGFKVENYE